MPVGPEIPLTALVDREVYGTDGVRVGRVVDVVVDLVGQGKPALAVGDVNPAAVGALPAEAAGVRIPFRCVRGVNDAVVLWLRVGEGRAVGSRTGEDGSDGDRGGDVVA